MIVSKVVERLEVTGRRIANLEALDASASSVGWSVEIDRIAAIEEL